MKHYKFVTIATLLLGLSILMIGCAKSEAPTNQAATPPANTAASPAAPAQTSSTGDIGVPECDAFLKAYEACVHDKVPAAARTTFDSTMATWRKTWHDQAANPQTKAALASACKTAQESAKTSMKAYGCTF